jgi:hypothetical protein
MIHNIELQALHDIMSQGTILYNSHILSFSKLHSTYIWQKSDYNEISTIFYCNNIECIANMRIFHDDIVQYKQYQHTTDLFDFVKFYLFEYNKWHISCKRIYRNNNMCITIEG